MCGGGVGVSGSVKEIFVWKYRWIDIEEIYNLLVVMVYQRSLEEKILVKVSF